MKHLFIINPMAGKYDRSHEVIGKIESVMANRDLDWDAHITAYRGHGTELARQAAETGQPVRIYACGGDGTLNEVVNGAAGYENAAVTHYPTGSGNDFIKMFGPDAPLFYDLSALLEGPSAPLDLIACNGRLSVNICSVGLDARIGLGMSDFKKYPGINGSMAYQLSLIKNVVDGIHRPYQIEVDGEAFEGDFTLLCACNGRYYGGGFNPSPASMPDDGILDFLLLRGVSRLTVAKLVKQYSAGNAGDMGDLAILRSGKEMRVLCDRMSMVNIDGERLDAESLTFRLAQEKVRFFFPQGTHWDPKLRGKTAVYF